MGRPRSYNPNTKAGRRNLRNLQQIRYNNKTQQEKESFDTSLFFGRLVLLVIAIIVCLLIVVSGGKIK